MNYSGRFVLRWPSVLGIMLGSSHSLPNAFPLFWSGGLMPHADYIFVSKEAAQNAGFTDRQTAVEGLVSDCRQG